jgi:hypothetical protein
LLNFREFWGDGQNNGFAYEAFVHPHQGMGEVFQRTGNGWIYHLTFNLPFLMTWPIELAALGGVSLAWRSRVRTPRYAPVLACTLCYFATLGLSQVRFLRYDLPLVPALCLLAALAVAAMEEGAFKLSGARLAALGLVAVALLGTVNVTSAFTAVDPRDQAAAYMSEHAGTTTEVGLLDPPWFWTPPLSPQDAPPGTHSEVDGSPDGRFNFVVTGLDSALLTERKPPWFVVSEFEWRDKERLDDADYISFKSSLDRNYSLAARFVNTPLLPLPGRAFVPHDYLYPDPEVRIYQRR